MSTADRTPERQAELVERYHIGEIKAHRWSGDPGVDQILEVFSTPHHYAPCALSELLDPSPQGPETHPVWFTPWHRRPKVVQDKIADLIAESRAMAHDPTVYATNFDLDLLHSDLLDRHPMPVRQDDDPNFGWDGKYRPQELRDEFINRSEGTEQRREALEKLERFYLENTLPAACESPNQVVIYHDSLPEFGDYREGERLPDGEPFVPTKAAFPVPIGWTAYRVARIAIARHTDGCVWCGAIAKPGDGPIPKPWAIMLVSTRGALHCITTCDKCVNEIGPGPDYYRYDGADALRGYPAERYR
ncbi:hypothetical protein ACPXCG_12260 [Gordonia sp. DT218]|uniref:hypothetical protein n=1 Tax=Gordonia sp. DT218 TaxID=3416659 RepID=UPI003CF615FE